MADEDNADGPVLRNGRHQRADKLGTKFVDHTGRLQEKAQGHKGAQEPGTEKSKGPAGGFDDTPVPRSPQGYTLKFTFHRAINLPFSDFNTISSDPYIVATIKTNLPKRHKEDPDLTLRTPTIHRNTNPEWNVEWIVANVPSSGFFLKCRLYDEDPADHDDRLGNVHVYAQDIGDHWTGFKEMEYDIKKRMGSKRAYFIRGCAALVSRKVKMGGSMFISIENLGKTEGDNKGRMYTAGPLPWSRHFSPLIGRLAGVKDSSEETKDGKKGPDKYNFQAIQIQLQGPVPEPLYHRYVEFKPFVAGMFTSHSLRGRILNRALHHQHARIYNYDRSTVYGIFQTPSIENTKKFLDFVHYDQGGRIFTYVITLDGQWRFTETGKEFGIDMLSKHTMHSDVSIYIAFSGEFFVRRLKHPRKNQDRSPDPENAALPPAPDTDEEDEVNHESKDGHSGSADTSTNPHDYELIIDNDSGTYRPNAKYLPTLKKFMEANLPNLRIVTLDCNGDEEKMKKLKGQQRDKKKESGKQMTYLQNQSQSSISSSDEQALNRRANDDHNTKSQKFKNDVKNVTGMMVPGRHAQGGDANQAASNEKTAPEESAQRPGPGTLQNSGVASGKEDPGNDPGAHQATTTTRTTTTTTTSVHS